MLESILNEFGRCFPEINRALSYGILIFARVGAFIHFAPVFNKKEYPSMVKTAFALIFTVMLTMVLKPDHIPDNNSLVLGIILNMTFGMLLGWLANCIVLAIEAGGDFINMQMGLSSAQMLDPSKGSMTSLMGRYFSFVAIFVFLQLGGMYWLMNALIRSFEIFPMYSVNFPLFEIFNLKYIVMVTSNLLFIGLQIASPVLLATLGQDIILGVISKTAPQINVFTLSFLFKPVFGAAILLWIFPMILNVMSDYFLSFSRIF